MQTQNQDTERLSTLMAFVGERYQFTPEHYPALAKEDSSSGREAFAISHSAHHMMKSLGRISTECEKFDHGGMMDREVLREAVVKMLINTIKLAEELGMSGTDLAEAVPKLMKSK